MTKARKFRWIIVSLHGGGTKGTDEYDVAHAFACEPDDYVVINRETCEDFKQDIQDVPTHYAVPPVV